MAVTVFLGDLGYYNDYNHTQPTPLNVAYIGSYLAQNVPEVRVELFKNPLKLMERIKSAPPQILGLSHYQWNSNLNLKIVEAAKALNPKTIAVMGGPHFDATNTEWMSSFFKNRPQIDFHIEREGERTFTELMMALLAADLEPDRLDTDDWPCTLFGYDHASRTLLHNPIGKHERLDLSTVPSPYLSGWMDEFLDDQYLAPIIETNRGCPYSCSFCAWGNATQSKVRQFPLEQVVEEIRYVSKRGSNPQKLLYLADANFGILKRDEEIARTIADCSITQGFPTQTYVYFAKNTNDKVIRVAELMRTVTSMSMSKQSVNDTVLENIKRKNIPHQQYDKLRMECENRGIKTFSELIYGLPGETYDSFVSGVIQTVRQKARIAIYPLLLIDGAENHTQEHRDMFGIKSKFRVTPRYISTMEGLRTLEYEEVAIENDALSFAEWFRIREFHFLIVLLASDTFIDLKLELEAHDLDYATLAKKIIADKENWPASWATLMGEFRKAATDELIEPEEMRTEYDIDEISDIELKYPAHNYYYYAMLLCSREKLNALKSYMLNGIKRFFPDAKTPAIDGVKFTIDLCFDRAICYENFVPQKTVFYSANLEEWESVSPRNELAVYKLEFPQEYIYRAEESIESRLSKLLESGMSLTDAVYKLRLSYIGYRGDVVFAYKREPARHASVAAA